MAEETTNVVETKSTTEVVGNDGKTLEPTPLSGIFDAMEAAKSQGKAAEEGLAQKPAVAVKQEIKKEEVKPTEVKVDVKEEVKPEQKEISVRDSLKTAFDEKQKEKDEKIVKKDDEVELPESELQPLPNDKPKTVQRIKALLKKIDAVSSEFTKTKAERDEKATKLADLEKKLSEVKTVNPETDERVKKELDELAMYRRRYEVENDPKTKKQFDERSEQAEVSINAALKKRGASEGLINLIKEEGGWAAFSGSNRSITLPDGDGGTSTVTAAELADKILAQLPLGERKAVEAAMLEQVQIGRDKARHIKEAQDSAVEFFKKKDEEGKAAHTQQQKHVEEAAKTIDDWQKKFASEAIKDREVPATANAQEKSSIEEFNKYNGQLRSYLKKAIETKDLNGMLEIIEDSVRYYDERRTSAQLREENKKLKADIAAKQEEVTKFKRSGASVPKGGSISSQPAAQVQQKKPQSLEEALEEIAAGRQLITADQD